MRDKRYIKPKRKRKVTFNYFVTSRLNNLFICYIKNFIAKI